MHEKKQFGLAQILGLYIDLSPLKGILAKVNGDLKFIVDNRLPFYSLCSMFCCQFVISEEKRFQFHWKKHASLVPEDTDLNEMFLIYMMNRKVNSGVLISCRNLLRPRTVYVCEEVINYRCLKIESDKRGMSRHGDKNHERKGCYTEFNLYFEQETFVTRFFNSNDLMIYRKKGRIPKIKRIVVPKCFGITNLFN
jgi:hypothetical protein